MNTPIHYRPICPCCDKETLLCDLYPSPINGDGEMWCGLCLGEFEDEIEDRAEVWREELRRYL